MFGYLLLRDNKQLGPYSLDELKSTGIKASDLVWVEGKSTGWRFADEIEELQSLVYVSPVNSRQLSNAVAAGENNHRVQEQFLEIGHDQKDFFVSPDEKKSSPLKETGNDNEQISKRTLNLRKNIFSKEVDEEYINHQPGRININQEADISDSSSSHIVKVVIADDHGLFREGVKTALAQKSDVKVIGEAENGMQLLNLLKHIKPDVILLDIQMPVMDGISALSSIRRLYPDLKVIVLSMHEGHSMVSTLMETGANGYLTKTADSDSIYQAIKTCREKSYYFNELTNISMLEGLRSKKRIPEKIVSSDFDGADLMRKLAASQKKSNGYASSKTQTKVLVAALSLLLIGASVLAALTMLGSSKEAVLPVKQKNIIDNSDQETSKQTPPPVESSLIISNDSSQKKNDAGIRGDERTNTLPDIEKNSQEKHSAKKRRDSANLQAPIIIQKIDTSNGKNSSSNYEKQPPSPDSELKTMSKKYIRNLLTTSANDYHKGLFGGLSEIEITVSNRSNFAIDEVIVEVDYLLSNSKLYKTESLTFENISPSSSKTLEAPKSSRGSTIEYKIVSIKSKDLDL